MMIGIEKNGIVISIGIGFGKNRFRKKYRYRFRKFLVSKKVSVSVSENFGIEKSIGFGIEKFWYRKKVSVSFRFLVSPLTAKEGHGDHLHEEGTGRGGSSGSAQLYLTFFVDF